MSDVKKLTNEELLQELCDGLQSVGTYKGPRTDAEGNAIVRSMKLRAELLRRLSRSQDGPRPDERINVIRGQQKVSLAVDEPHEGKTHALPNSAAAQDGVDVEAVRKLLELMYDRWENGADCYEDPEDHTGYLGKAFKLSFDEENEIIAALRSASAPRSAQQWRLSGKFYPAEVENKFWTDERVEKFASSAPLEGWRKVDAELPEAVFGDGKNPPVISEDVLVFFPGGDGSWYDIANYDHEEKKWSLCTHQFKEPDCDPTHWRELPTPPSSPLEATEGN